MKKIFYNTNLLYTLAVMVMVDIMYLSQKQDTTKLLVLCLIGLITFCINKNIVKILY